MALATAESSLYGSPTPRIGPELVRGDIAHVLHEANALGYSLMPHQEFVCGVAEATGPDGRFLYPDLVDVEARQNGKSTKLSALIRSRILRGRRIIHTAQNRIIPRRVFIEVAGSFSKHEARVRFANGQEEVELRDGGGRYVIVAPQRGVRGLSGDDLIVDEVREYEDTEFIDAARPILAASDNPQVIYLSNAGDVESVVLNDLRARQGAPGLAYMEWSAPAELEAGDRAGWAMANPALGRTIRLEYLEREFANYRDSGNLAGWETEHLCRWVLSMAPRLVDAMRWQAARGTGLGKPLMPFMGISVAPEGTRASAAFSWPLGGGSVGLMVAADVRGNPVDLDRFATDLVALATEAGVQGVGFDPLTDQHLARYWPNSKPLSGVGMANAVERFVRSVESGQLRWAWADQVTEDLPHVGRKPIGAVAFTAERADAKRPITAALAAIRAVWLALEPNTGAPTVF